MIREILARKMGRKWAFFSSVSASAGITGQSSEEVVVGEVLEIPLPLNLQICNARISLLIERKPSGHMMSI